MPPIKLFVMSSKNEKCQAALIMPLIEDAKWYLQQSGLRPSTIKSIVDTWKGVISFMEGRKIHLYSASVECDYLEYYLKNVGIGFSYNWGQTLKSRMRRLTEFLTTGEIKKRTKLSPSFTSEIGQSINSFLEQRIRTCRLSEYTIRQDRYYLSIFLDYMNRHNVLQTRELDVRLINEFLSSLDSSKKSLRHHVIRELRLYLRHLYENDLLKNNLARMLPTDAYRQMERLPSVYTKDEINTVCRSIDRSNPLGKRDYAIMMLLSRYGLRASDICGLQFEDINWDRCLIQIVQYKTGYPVELPLTSEIGVALIDYLKDGRPLCDNGHVFVQGISPFQQLATSGIGYIVKKRFREAGIDRAGRKCGPHTLRHSLASLLLKERVVLPVITGILGHKDSDSTRSYLRLDTESLRACALDVPPVADGFYKQEGGVFYE